MFVIIARFQYSFDRLSVYLHTTEAKESKFPQLIRNLGKHHTPQAPFVGRINWNPSPSQPRIGNHATLY